MRPQYLLALAALLPLRAQEPAPPSAGTPEAAALVDQGIAKMLAFGRGAFHTSESQDMPMFRGADVPLGKDPIEVKGGWQQDLVWCESRGDHFVRNGGRMLGKVGDGWRLRRSKLASGQQAPFAVDPNLLFTVLRDLPVAARDVVAVAGAEIGGRQVVVLSLDLEEEAAAEFADSGVIPVPGDQSMAGIFVFAGGGGFQMPQPRRRVHLALSIDPANGDVLRLAAKVYEKNPMFGGVAVVQAAPAQAAGGGGGAEEDVPDEKAPAEREIRPERVDGLPTRDPEGDESVLTYRIDFQELGLAKAPVLDDKSRELLRLR
jgi:hypothetical protein